MPLKTQSNIGHYKIISPLGVGGMGEVYLAQDTKLDRKIALKILPAEFAEDSDRMNRFVREAKAASALNHPNIITIYEIGESEGTHFIATEFIDGKTLNEYERVKPLDYKTVLEIVIQIASALDEAHQRGIVHRDIKPENIMVRANGLAKILDFGIAKLSASASTNAEAATAIKSGTNPGMIVGTANYMSPEQAAGKTVDARSDIFSFGVLLYEMISHKLPFAGDTAMEMIGAILKDEPKPLGADVPAEIKKIINRCLEKDRAERYQTINDVLIDLKTAQKSLEFEDKSNRTVSPDKEEPQTRILQATTFGESQPAVTSSAEYLVGEVKKHKRFSFAGAAALLVVIFVGGYFAFFSKRATAFDSVAVLPFVNASGNQETEFLSDGISETLINNFTKIPSLRVTARSTAFRYKGKETDPQIIGKDLNVGAILTGKVLQRGDSLSVQVDLINAADGTQIWGNQYNAKASEILNVQQSIARDVSEQLKLKLSGAQEQQIAKNYTTNPEAFQLYLKGRFYWNRRTGDNLEKAIEQFKAAAEKDPNYALTYAGLADCYAVLEAYTGTPASETLPQARSYAERALVIDEQLAEAHATLGLINMALWQWTEAEKEFKRAIELNPNYATAHHWYHLYLHDVGRHDEAFTEIKRAQELEPLSSVISGNVSLAYITRNDPNPALENSRKYLELNPNDDGSYQAMGLAYLKLGRNAEALAALEKAVELSGRDSNILGDLGYAYAVTGKRAEALAIIKELEGRYARRESIGQYLAQVYAGLGEKDEAFNWLEKDFQARSQSLGFVRWLFTFDALRSDARYADLLRRMNLPQ